MHVDVKEMRDFYADPLGGVARRLIVRRLRARWPNISGLSLVGLGYATPYLERFRGEASHIAAMMPAGQGVVTWPPAGPYRTTLVEPDSLPLAGASVDRIIAVHSLEHCEGAHGLLREVWRVLAPEGKVMLVVPNRRGLWAGPESTPFGHGRPYSRGQLTNLLESGMFKPEDITSALFMPPFRLNMLTRSAVAWERVGGYLWPAFSGVIIVEATKQVMGVVPRKGLQVLKDRLRPITGVVPVPDGTAALDTPRRYGRISVGQKFSGTAEKRLVRRSGYAGKQAL